MYKSTIEYFGLSASELATNKENLLTKEECLLFGEGLKTIIFDHLSNLEEYLEYHLKDLNLKVKTILKTIEGKFALILY